MNTCPNLPSKEWVCVVPALPLLCCEIMPFKAQFNVKGKTIKIVSKQVVEWQRKVKEISLHSIQFLPKQPIEALRNLLILGFSSVPLGQYRDMVFSF